MTDLNIGDAIMFCPHCHWYTAGNPICPRCGVSLVKTEEKPPAPAPAPTPAPPPPPVQILPAVEAPPMPVAPAPKPVAPPPAPAPAPPPDDTDFTVRNGILVRYNGTARQVVIPPGVRVISSDAFAGRADIENVAIPEGVREIAGSAFYKCEKLAFARIPASVDTISRQAFASAFDPRYPLTSRVALPALRTVEMSPEQWKKYYYLFPYTEQSRRITQQKKWRDTGLCQHCGGRISFLSNQCKSCGKMKDY